LDDSDSVEKNTFDVVFLLPPRLEFAALAKALFATLSKIDISMMSIVTISAGDWREVENAFVSSKIPFKKLSDFSGKTSLEVLLELKPQLIITDNDLMNMDRTFVLSGQYLHIPTMVIREANTTLGKEINYLWLSYEIIAKLNQLPRLIRVYMFYVRSASAVKPILVRNVPNLILTLLRGFEEGIVGNYADYILANTQEDAEALRKQCQNAKLVRAVGNPRFDETMNLSKDESTKARIEIQRTFNIPSNSKIILFLSSAQVEHGMLTKKQKILANQQILSVMEQLREKADFDLLIKLHPMEKDLFPLIWKPNYNEYVHVTTFDLSKLIAASDLVFSWYSTAMINVVVARKPLVVINFHKDRENAPEAGGILPSTLAIADNNAAVEATNANELYKCMFTILSDHEFREKLKQSQEAFHSTYLKTIDGNSINRIAETIRQIIGTKTQSVRLVKQPIKKKKTIKYKDSLFTLGQRNTRNEG